MRGALLVAGTTSDAGKSIVTAGLCRWLARKGVKVAPFKSQNMALNSFVTRDGAEIGRAQAMQAAAAGVEPEAVMNPVLLKPGANATSQVVVLGTPAGSEDARSYQQRKVALLPVVLDALADLRARYDVVICEGAGSPTEINLRTADIANMGLARAARLPTIVVGDIDRGGVFAALYGTVALLDAADQALVSGFVINKFRGDQRVLDPGLAQLHTLTGRPVLGVIPHAGDLRIDAEDSLALDAPLSGAPPRGRDSLEVAVVRVPYLSNATDVDALACEPGVNVRFTTSAADIASADLVVLPGTRATVAALDFIRSSGIDAALLGRAAAERPTIGICGGYQLLGRRIVDDVESRRGVVDGLGLLPVDTVFAPDKTLRRPEGTAPALGGVPAAGYEIHHGVSTVEGAEPLLQAADGVDDGCAVGAVVGTSWHGVFEGDEFRRAMLAWVADARGLEFVAGNQPFADVREQRLDVLGDLIERHVDTGAIEQLLTEGAPSGLPVLTGGLA